MEYSSNGAPILSGKGLSDTRGRIMAAFDRSRELAIPTPEPEIEVVEESTEEVVARFQERAQHLTSAALTSAYVVSEITNGPIHVTRPKESAEELFALATN